MNIINKKIGKRRGAIVIALLLMGTGCSTYGDFGGSASVFGASVGGYIGWGTPPAGGGGGGGHASQGATGTNSQGGATTGTTSPVTTRPKSGSTTTGTAITESGHYTADTNGYIPATDGNISLNVYNVRAGDY